MWTRLSPQLIQLFVKMAALFTVGSASSSPICTELAIDNKPVHFSQKHLSPSTVTLKTYTGETTVLGEVEVSVRYEQQPLQQLPLVIVEGDKLSLLGHSIKLNWSYIKAISMPNELLPNILENFKF